MNSEELDWPDHSFSGALMKSGGLPKAMALLPK